MSALQVHGPSDEELARRTAAGDVDAFEELYRRYSGPLTAYAGRLLRDPVAAEDAAQVALLNAYQALRRGSSPAHARAWLYRITRNVALETIERRDETTPLDERACGADAHEASEARDDLLTALRTLPDRQRTVFVLRELHGLRIREIAERVALAPAQVEQALFAARNRLAEHLTFGERIDCASVQSLDAARLSRAERRAIKSHVRACPSCRTAPSRARAGVLLLPLDWARNAALALFGGGSAAKAAAVVAAAAAVGATPIVVDELPTASARAAAPTHVVEQAAPPNVRVTPARHPRMQVRRRQRDEAIPVVITRAPDEALPAAPEVLPEPVAEAPPPKEQVALDPEPEREPEPESVREPASPAVEPAVPEEGSNDPEPEPIATEPPVDDEPTRLENVNAEPSEPAYDAGPSNR